MPKFQELDDGGGEVRLRGDVLLSIPLLLLILKVESLVDCLWWN